MPERTTDSDHLTTGPTPFRSIGGLTPETEMLTVSGPKRASAVSVGEPVYALNPDTGLLKQKPVASVETVRPQAPLVEITSLRADLRLEATHPIYFQTKTIDRPRTVQARHLDDRVYYRFLNDWRPLPGQRLGTVDLTDLTERYEARVHYDGHGNAFRARLPDGCEPCRGYGHTGYHFDSTTFKRHQATLERLGTHVEICSGPHSWGRPYRFDGDDFLALLGWYITEGSITPKNNRDSVAIKIAQEDPAGRERLHALFDRLGIDAAVSDRAFSFGSSVYADVLERLCGGSSTERHLPWFIWSLCQAQQQHLLDVLVAGDGDARGTYYTASRDLARDLLRLSAHIGRKPQYQVRKGNWRISTSSMRDGFRSDRNVRWLPPRGPVVRLTVEDYPAVLAGRNGNFQWVGVSRLA